MNPEFVEFQVCADASYASEQLSQSESGSNELITPSQSTSLLILIWHAILFVQIWISFGSDGVACVFN
jgi:hypothetical protein